MKYKLPVTIARLGKDAYMARCDVVRATATADTPEEAIKCLREAIDEMVAEYGEGAVFQDVGEEIEVRVIEVGR
ncbi:MAG: hypothetical protein D9V47_06335 [Clostridia bacterium]|nr:MAG: hypothetical protein D9V47_06335 [Clostridia bacterium]